MNKHRLNKKAVQLAMSTIIVAIIALVILFVTIMLFIRASGPVAKLNSCQKITLGRFACEGAGVDIDTNSPQCYSGKGVCDDEATLCCPKKTTTT